MKGRQHTGALGTARRTRRIFADAVLAFSDDPGPANLERYLAASRALEESRRPRRKRGRTLTRAGGATVVARPDATSVRI